VAAANWLALASWVCAAGAELTAENAEERGEKAILVSPQRKQGVRSALARAAGSGSGGLLIDIGSTTTDITPWEADRPAPRGLTDRERLRSAELVYTGVRRTPVCALLGARQGEDHFAAELFATTLDVFLLLGLAPEAAADCDTADGRPATRAAAHARLARIMCADAESCSTEEVVTLAQRVLRVQMDVIGQALVRVADRLSQPPARIVLAGAGEFLGRRVLADLPSFASCDVLSLADVLGPSISQCACAYAVACLACQAGSP
jgi:(4-(4-[2-(gamma-L-glutamylamino)ethyl]phenoxymethyl)furan-2-yl)methanamine synthase